MENKMLHRVKWNYNSWSLATEWKQLKKIDANEVNGEKVVDDSSRFACFLFIRLVHLFSSLTIAGGKTNLCAIVSTCELFAVGLRMYHFDIVE